MREFFVGLLVLVAFLVLSLFGILLFPLFLVLGYALKCLIAVLIVVFAIWFLGKVSLMSMEWLRNKKG